MSSATIVFPHQLFAVHPAIRKDRPVYLIEEELFFAQYPFHKKKLVLHRASMKYYCDFLRNEGFRVHYVEVCAIADFVANISVDELHYAEVTDDWLQRRLLKAAEDKGIRLFRYATPYFLNTRVDREKYVHEHDHYFQTNFYIGQRKQRRLLLDAGGKPAGGKWSFDEDNRQRLPAKHRGPSFDLPGSNKYVPEAIGYVQEKFGGNYGDLDPPFFKKTGFWPVTHKEAENWLQSFLEERFRLFGAYEDAMQVGEGLLYHSALSPMLNTGLLTPKQVLDEAIAFASKHRIPLNSAEGFVRQLIGWREFVHLVYEKEGRKQRTRNYWKFYRKIPKQFWTASTGIMPVDTVITRVLNSGYCHHIERLMVLGSFMLLCEFDPDEVYRWFMELFIDSYDWVMVPNTYGMTQFADGGLMTTKPYISGSNYLVKMGNWPKGDWQAVWDGLFWRFMHVHRPYFERNARLAVLTRALDRMKKPVLDAHLRAAETFLASLDAAAA